MPAKWIAFKPECRCTPGSLPLVTELVRIAAECAPELHEDTLVVSSMGEGPSHKPGSMHYAGAAVDIRTHPNDDGSARTGSVLDPGLDAAIERWATVIRKRSGASRQAIYEKERKHLHIEIDYDSQGG
jgi:hypothetical protein